ncbi:hypothetical protein Cri9333_1556 [Crinalium epipsammum PCC 9333]|uniref:Uncharacterized protein n=1 Tax=Crinalium epipsammum PCC 9333 TaxID=1173022 RepID=K9VWG9_9CYAN|nr:hypothetical protein [Crinalium epipsammum]AFZ12448.1 hypothetical protein Cri9333_1556 [Crinalium epipsammum PCC 9333]
MPSLAKFSVSTKTSRPKIWFERGMALLVLINLGIVLFDYSYIPLRNFYLKELPRLTKIYDPVKAIEPNRDTEKYLTTVEQLKAEVKQAGLQSPKTELLLQQLRQLSVEMIDKNPFEVVNKTGTLEKIKNRMRRHVRQESSKEAFQLFWSRKYLSQSNWSKEINFYDQNIQPLLATNYFRPYGETGDFVDYFWQIDIWFIIVFGFEFIIRTYYIHRRHLGLTWLEAMLWRWYDVFLLLPVWRSLRLIPLVIRLHQSHLVNLDSLQAHINYGFVSNFAEELTEVVVIRVINQMQAAIQRGDLKDLLSNRLAHSYIDLNNINEVEAIANVLVKVTVYKVLPKIQPDLEAILRHSLNKVLDQSPIYRNLKQVPGIGNLPIQLIDQLINEVSQSTYTAIKDTLEDPVGAKLSQDLVQHFSEALGTELQRQHTLQKIQSLLFDLLEEIKINYVQDLSEEDLQRLLQQTRKTRKTSYKNK